MKIFNINGLCGLEENYMVDMNGKIAKIKNLVSDRIYFSIGNTPKCGKSTLLVALWRRLQHQYTAVSVNFNRFNAGYPTAEKDFCREFIRQVADELNYISPDKPYVKKWLERRFQHPELCRRNPVHLRKTLCECLLR